jgi:non-specific serine/threonine protein kinase/serine/threonine-protein kinase
MNDEFEHGPEWARVVALFDSAMEIPRGEREAWLMAACGSDAALFAEVRSLVAAAESESEASADAARGFAETGQRFGAWETIRVLGSGGMGTVLLARRIGEFEQEAALKLIAPHLVGPYFADRFRVERQILANLNHPNITKLLDGGVAESGAPFLVMEYVDGPPLSVYADERKLPVRERIVLFLKICEALEYAHRNLVVHRDLKPGNILIEEATREPKLLDFGTARVLDDSGEAPVTRHRLVTPRYASPEALRHAPVSTQSDVYSLGIILYEQVTGGTPFRGAPAEEGRFLPPESAINAEAAAARGCSLRELGRVAKSDLARILRKATEPDPQHRYRSVADLAADIRAYLDGRPVLAREQTLPYRTLRFVLRHKIATACVGLAAMAIVAGTVSTLWQARKAERRFQEVRQMANHMIFDLNADLQQIPGTTALQRRSVERSLAYLDRLTAEAGGDATLRLELAKGYRNLGDVLGNPFRANLGDRSGAEAAYRRGLAAIQTSSPELAARLERAKLELQIASMKSFGGNPAELAGVREAVERLRSIGAEKGASSADTTLEVARALLFLGGRVSAGGGNVEDTASEEAEKLFGEAEREARSILDRSPGHGGAIRVLAQIDNSRAIRIGSSEPEKAVELHGRALGWLSRLQSAEASGLDARRLRANILLNTGWAEGQAGKYADSIAHVQEAGAILEAWAAADPEDTNARYQTSGVYRTLGIVHGYRGDGAPAVEAFLRAAAIHEKLSAIDPRNKVYRFLRGEVLLRAGNWMVKLDRAADARVAASEGLKLLLELASAPSASLTHLFGACRWFSETEVRTLRDPKRAAGFCRSAIERTGGKDPDGFMGLALALYQSGDRAGASEAAAKAITLLPPVASGKAKSQQRKDMEALLERYRSR